MAKAGDPSRHLAPPGGVQYHRRSGTTLGRAPADRQCGRCPYAVWRALFKARPVAVLDEAQARSKRLSVFVFSWPIQTGRCAFFFRFRERWPAAGFVPAALPSHATIPPKLVHTNRQALTPFLEFGRHRTVKWRSARVLSQEADVSFEPVHL